MFRRKKSTNAQKQIEQDRKRKQALQKEIKRYVKEGFKVIHETEFSASLERPRVSTSKRMQRVGLGMMTLGILGGRGKPEWIETVYITVNAKGKVKATKGKADL